MTTADKNDLAEKRTDWAEDRTIMANERTFAGWMRTGLSSIAIGLGFQALFRHTEPTWVARAAATLFVLVGIFIFASAYHSSRKVLSRLDAQDAEPVLRKHLLAICGSLMAGAIAILLILWFF